MAEFILFDIAGEIIKKLGSRALQEIGLRWGLEDELDKLKSTISAIHAVLLDAEKKSAKEQNNQLKDWLGKLQEVVYHADDLLDDFSTEALRRQVMDGNKVTKEVCLFFSRSNPFAYGIKMAREIKAIRERLDAIAKDKQQFHFTEQHTETPSISMGRDQTISYVDEEDVIGRDNDKEKILKLLFDSNAEDNVSVLPIVGLGGLGKTTLAQYIYNDGQVINHFDLKIWVCVSDVFDIKVIVEKAIKSVTNKEPENLELDQLQCNLRGKISGKKYLLVLDDVWNEDLSKWLVLMSLLKCGARGSSIIVTTRSEEVAAITRTMPHFSLGGLSSSESWSLFKKIAFERREPKNLDVKDIEEEIIKKCAGVPLAIRTISCLLCSEIPETKWLSILENDLLGKAQNENVLLNTLKLSYDHLSVHLKYCFAYCALFPKDYEIDVKTLIHLWIAQGFVNSSNNSQCVEDVALEYFTYLYWRSFFQEVKRDELGNVVSCKMHDLMHDLATLVAGTGIKLINLDEKSFIEEKTYHVAFEDESNLQILNSFYSAKKLRTFLLLKKSHTIDNVIFSKLRRLRVCALQTLENEKLPPSLKRLKHLRYIHVSNASIKALPNSICELINLQVLNVSNCWNLKELPKDIRKLINLRHLYNEECMRLRHMPRGFGQLTSLQTLSEFVVGNKHNNKNVGGLNELNSLNNLRGSLQIRHLERVKSESYELCNLKEKQHLRSLSLIWDSDDDDVNVDFEEMLLRSLQPHPNLKELYVFGYGGRRFPTTWFSSLTNLVRIQIEYCKRCEYLPPLNEIPSLQNLLMNGFHDLEYIEMEGTTTSFPSLKRLSLRGFPKLMGWLKKKKKREDDYDGDDSDDSTVPEKLLQFPCLSGLDCIACPKLTWLPQFPSLDEYMYLLNVSAKLVEKILTPSISYSSSSSNVPPLSKLKNLNIKGIEDLESLPADGLQNLTSLQELNIEFCRRLKSLPQQMRYLTSLQHLNIWNCPQLEERCRNNKGEDWPIISHIPNIEVGIRNRIQWNGCYLVDEE